ncbi:MAG: iron ABC transporter permease [Rhodospirillales bacterium]|nr:iron ABC transporter permease [Rhodospirillales bacterium]MBO6787382.1 iron ABC transporter permease [Rhodospirillales bacterium]
MVTRAATTPGTGKVHLRLTSWGVASLGLTLVFLAPILSVFIAAAGDTGDLWPHLFRTVLPRYIGNTLVLMAGVACISLLFGVSTAWLVTRYAFPGRRVLEWMLLLPAAVPTYLIAYTYTDFLEYAGPVQQILRDVFGWQSARDYWFPEIRSMGGATLVLGAVLYPYVYMMARAAFMLTPASLFEVGMLAKRSEFWSVGLPLARPAIVAGLALVMMETVSEFGVVEYFAIETITLGIFNVWLGMNSLPAAAKIASVCFLFIIALLAMEILARSRRRFINTSRKSASLPLQKLSGGKALLCLAACLAPIVIGFVIPVGVLLNFVLKGYSLEFSNAQLSAAWHSISLAASVALLIVASASFLGFVAHYQGGKWLKRITAVASMGYAFPGTILAIGVITAAGTLDDGIAAIMDGVFGITYHGWLTSGVGLVAVACAIRFQAIGYGAVTTGLGRLPPNMMNASRVLGRTFAGSLIETILPLMRLSLITGGLLVFVDVMKELPMTLLLRPFNYETLATYVYQFAKDELLEQAAMPALFIVIVGIVPVVLMNATLRR